MFCVGSFLTIVMGDGYYADAGVDLFVLLMMLYAVDVDYSADDAYAVECLVFDNCNCMMFDLTSYK